MVAHHDGLAARRGVVGVDALERDRGGQVPEEHPGDRLLGAAIERLAARVRGDRVGVEAEQAGRVEPLGALGGELLRHVMAAVARVDHRPTALGDDRAGLVEHQRGVADDLAVGRDPHPGPHRLRLEHLAEQIGPVELVVLVAVAVGAPREPGDVLGVVGSHRADGQLHTGVDRCGGDGVGVLGRIGRRPDVAAGVIPVTDQLGAIPVDAARVVVHLVDEASRDDAASKASSSSRNANGSPRSSTQATTPSSRSTSPTVSSTSSGSSKAFAATAATTRAVASARWAPASASRPSSEAPAATVARAIVPRFPVPARCNVAIVRSAIWARSLRGQGCLQCGGTPRTIDPIGGAAGAGGGGSMDTAAWQRYCAMGGIFFVVLAVVGTLVMGSPPSPTDTPREILEYYRDNEGGIGVGSYLNVLAVLGLVFWLGALWTTLRRAEGGAPRLTVVAGLGAAISGACAMVSQGINAANALRADELGPEGAKFFYTLSLTVIAAGAGGIAALVLATSIVSIRSGVFPTWVGWGGVLLGVIWLLAGLGVASDKDVIGIFGLIGFALWSIWIVVISVLMMRAAREPAPA